MDKNERVEKIQQDFADLLNDSAIKTPEKAKPIAHALLQQGIQPTWRLIREILGTGSASTLQNVVNNYWVELGQRLNHLEKRADVPNDLAKEFNKLWDKALKQAQIEVETRLKADFTEAETIKKSSQARLTEFETEVEQLKADKIQREEKYTADMQIHQSTHQQLKTQWEQQLQEIKQLKKLYQQADNMSQHQQQQAQQLEAVLEATKQEYKHATEQLRNEQQQTLERQAKQYESMIDHYANELGQLKVTHEKQGKQYQQQRTEWQKQQENTTQQFSRFQIENAIFSQENQQLKKAENVFQQNVEVQQAMLLTLEKEKATLQAHCVFFEASNTTLKEQLDKKLSQKTENKESKK